MNNLCFEKIALPVADLGSENSLPPIISKKNVQQNKNTDLDEDDGLFVGYGFLNSSFPYRLQDNFNRNLKLTQLDCAVLENDYLKAVFLPSYGGRLYSLYDKVNEKDLLYTNPVIRFGNLAIRNAWFSGGIEWNCGMIGHHPFTCSPIFTTSLVSDDNIPVLRMYEYERIRKVIFQMDFFLPEGSKLLYCRIRIVNPNNEVTPMYWWSNIAVKESKHGRVIVDADCAYTYSVDTNTITKVNVPINDNTDITYPVNNKNSIDYFWKVNSDKRKYICHVDEDGYGLIQTSTRRLKGRKLFVWGQGLGGQNWQKFLSGNNCDGKYIEIQAGLANTQYECLPMPPNTAWEWIEAYGSISINSNKTHNDWNEAQNEVKTALDSLITEDNLEKLLQYTRKSIALKKANKIIFYGSGWGALEILRRQYDNEAIFCSHLDFGDIQKEQEQWLYLLKYNCFENTNPNDIPMSWICQSQWEQKLINAVNNIDSQNWYTWLHLGAIYFAQNHFLESEKAFKTSIKLEPSCWAYYGLCNLESVKGNKKNAAMFAYKALMYKQDDISIAKEAFKFLFEAEFYELIIETSKKLSKQIQDLGRIKMYVAYSYLKLGQTEKAEQILHENGGLCVNDIQEGEISITELWCDIEKAKANRDGKLFDFKTVKIPEAFDFRMS